MPPGAVWSALAEPEQLAAWWGDYISLDVRLGGALVEEWSDSSGRLVVTSGDVTEMQTERLLVLSWRDQGWPADTEVRIEIEPLEGGRSRLTLTHSGWDAFPAERREQLVTAHRSGWERHLASLADHLGG